MSKGERQKDVNDSYRKGWDTIWGDEKDDEQTRPDLRVYENPPFQLNKDSYNRWVERLVGKNIEE